MKKKTIVFILAISLTPSISIAMESIERRNLIAQTILSLMAQREKNEQTNSLEFALREDKEQLEPKDKNFVQLVVPAPAEKSPYESFLERNENFSVTIFSKKFTLHDILEFQPQLLFSRTIFSSDIREASQAFLKANPELTHPETVATDPQLIELATRLQQCATYLTLEDIPGYDGPLFNEKEYQKDIANLGIKTLRFFGGGRTRGQMLIEQFMQDYEQQLVSQKGFDPLLDELFSNAQKTCALLQKADEDFASMLATAKHFLQNYSAQKQCDTTIADHLQELILQAEDPDTSKSLKLT